MPNLRGFWVEQVGLVIFVFFVPVQMDDVEVGLKTQPLVP